MQKNLVTIDGKEYDLASLSEEARNLMTNLRICDAELRQLNARLAITQTARNTYARALTEALPK